jgi:hypothetical protein
MSAPIPGGQSWWAAEYLPMVPQGGASWKYTRQNHRSTKLSATRCSVSRKLQL